MWITLGRPLLAPNHVRRSFFGLFLGVGSWVPKVAFWACFGQFGALPVRAVPIARFLALPGFGPGGAIMCDIGFLGAFRFFGRPVAQVAVPGGLGKFGFCSFGFCSVWPLSYQSTN